MWLLLQRLIFWWKRWWSLFHCYTFLSLQIIDLIFDIEWPIKQKQTTESNITKIRVLLGAPTLFLVHPAIVSNSVNASTPSSSFLSCCLSFFSFTVCFLLLVLVFHCWERCRFGGGESVMGQWWLLRWLVRRRRYTGYALLLGEWVDPYV